MNLLPNARRATVSPNSFHRVGGLALLLVTALVACTPKLTQTTSCDAGQVLQSTADGGWACADAVNAGGGVSVTNSPGGPTISLGDGGVIGDLQTQVAALASAVQTLQAKTLPACSPGQLISAASDGGWQCLTLGTGVAVADGGVITIVPASTDCPPGYARVPGSNYIACTKNLPDAGGVPDQVVKVGDFWIDALEISACGNGIVGWQAGLGSENGYQTTAFACSVGGVLPQGDITWFQAAQLCANAGKHLCTNAEWQTAASGTPDPGAYPGAAGSCAQTDPGAGAYQCNTCSSGPRLTGYGGLQQQCTSSFGAQEMIGNLTEWTADWVVAGPNPPGYAALPDGGLAGGACITPWPADYADDATCSVNGSSITEDTSTLVGGVPAVALRGGAWGSMAGAGVFSDDLQHAPDGHDPSIGARCCIGP